MKLFRKVWNWRLLGVPFAAIVITLGAVTAGGVGTTGCTDPCIGRSKFIVCTNGCIGGPEVCCHTEC